MPYIKSSTFASAFVVFNLVFTTLAFQPHSTRFNEKLSTEKLPNTIMQKFDDTSIPTEHIENLLSATRAAVSTMTLSLLFITSPAGAVSGGGSDFASLDISGKDFSNSNYKGKDFTQVVAKGTNFSNSNLIGCRFYNSYLVNSDFSGSDSRGAQFERNNMDGVNLKDADLRGAYFGESLSGVQTIENADFTDASIPAKTLGVICDREDAKGTNPKTGELTRDTLMCP